MSTPAKTVQQRALEPKTPKKHADPDYQVIRLKYQKYDDFEQLIVSHLTRHLDLPGTKLDTICGAYDPKSIVNHEKKPSGLNFLSSILGKSKDSSSSSKDQSPLLPVDQELVGQICQLTDYLSRNLDVEGIFRKSGSCVRQQQLMTALGTGAHIDFDRSNFKALDAAGALKEYLSFVKEPLLIPSKYFDAHLQIAAMNTSMQEPSKENNVVPNKMKRIECLQLLLLLLLPTEYRELLRGILNLLYQTAKFQKNTEMVNKMTAANLSTVVTPRILWPRHMKAADLKDKIPALNDHVAFMIRYSSKLFAAPSHIREKASKYFPFVDTPTCLSPKVKPIGLVAPSSAVKRTVTRWVVFVFDRGAQLGKGFEN